MSFIYDPESFNNSGINWVIGDTVRYNDGQSIDFGSDILRDKGVEWLREFNGSGVDWITGDTVTYNDGQSIDFGSDVLNDYGIERLNAYNSSGISWIIGNSVRYVDGQSIDFGSDLMRGVLENILIDVPGLAPTLDPVPIPTPEPTLEPEPEPNPEPAPSSKTINFGDFVLTGNLAEGDDSDNRILINDNMYRHIPVNAEYVAIGANGGNDRITIAPHENSYFQYYGGPSKEYAAYGGSGNDVLKITASHDRYFKGIFFGGEGVDCVEHALPSNLNGWILEVIQDHVISEPVVNLRNGSEYIDLKLYTDVEAIGSGNTWFSVAELYRGVVRPLAYKDAINPQPELTPDPEAEPYDGIIESVRGKGKLKGTKFADAFTFDSYDVFTKKSADKIIGFDASEGDKIAVSSDAFPGLQGISDISFASTKKKKELKQLSKQDYDFVYFEKKGQLYFDGNGIDKNWGSSDEGGLFAVLKGKPDLTVDDFTVLA